MKIFIVASIAVILMTITGCSQPWYPYPYFNPQVTEKEVPEKPPVTQAPESDEDY